MMRFTLLLLFGFSVLMLCGQSSQVHRKMRAVDMTLIISEPARREIQKDVDALMANPQYFEKKADRARIYFPIIERILSEVGVPDDIKFLVLQESGLVSDAVSSSNAVGYWQFKDFTAKELGMRVDKRIDERMNLISSTKGAAEYIKKNNIQFNNWIYAIQSYQMGPGGALRVVGGKHEGVRKMEITKNTYWYIKKFLAHKIAFEHALDGKPSSKVMLYQPKEETSLLKIAKKFRVEPALLTKYNKWSKDGIVPKDKSYTVLIPESLLDALGTTNDAMTATVQSDTLKKTSLDYKEIVSVVEYGEINRVPVVKAQPNDRLATLAHRGSITLNALLRYNEISIDHTVVPGTFYYLRKKRDKATKPLHIVRKGETLWTISQMYGIRLKKLCKYNDVHPEDSLKVGSTLWLGVVTPYGEGHLDTETPVVEIDDRQIFGWKDEALSSQ